jgi:gliding motility-associated-like protein
MRLFLFIFLFVCNFTFSQYCPYLGPDQLLPCGVNSTTLVADLTQCSQGVNPNQTTTYNVSQIPYQVQNNNGNQLFMSDDSQQGPFNIGFNFCFFGQTYNQFWVGSNGWISFSAGQPTTFTSTPIPSVAGTVPKNCVMGPWQDWHPGVGGQIRYQVQGVAPCRKLVVSWINVPMFQCTNVQGTFHIVMYESTNYIENHIQIKPNCLTWAGGTAVQGLHNQAGTVAITTPGRNSTAWTAIDDAYRWTPSGPVVNPTLTWFQVGNPIPLGTGPTLNVTPPQQGAYYTCQFVYPSCNVGWGNCTQQSGFGPDTVFVLPGPPNLTPPSILITDVTCNNDCDGEILVTPTSGVPPFTINWSGGLNGLNPINLCSGTYNYTLTDNNGCDYNSSVVLLNPPPIIINNILGDDTLCVNSTNNTFVINGNQNLTYNWSSTSGQITNGQGTNQINLDISGLSGGYYQDILSVFGQDSNGCLSQVENWSLYVLDVPLTINNLGPFCVYDSCVVLNGTPNGGQFYGNNVTNGQYCPSNGFIGVDTITYNYSQSGCLFNASITTTVNPTPVVQPITNGVVGDNLSYHLICVGEKAEDKFGVSSVNLNGFNEWYFMNQIIIDDELTTEFVNEGVYRFYVIRNENGCLSEPLNFNITVEVCPENLLFIPNTFTPDGNGYNETWNVRFISEFNYIFKLEVFNRWGQLLWVTQDQSIDWDGTHHNKLVPIGVYTWKLSYGTTEEYYKKEIYGHVNVIR